VNGTRFIERDGSVRECKEREIWRWRDRETETETETEIDRKVTTGGSFIT